MLVNLISASINQNDCSRLEKVPRNLLSDAEREVVDWLIEYNNKYDTLPTVERFKKDKYQHFYCDVLLTTPLDDLLEETLNNLKYVAVERAWVQIQANNSMGKPFDFALLDQLSNDLAMAQPIQTRSVSSYTIDELIPNPGDYIPLGLDNIDKASGGVGLGETAELFANTGIGKTTFLCFLAVRAARAGYKVFFITKEMSDFRIMQKISAILGNFDPFWYIKSASDANYVSKLKAKSAFVKKQTDAYESIGGDIIIPRASIFCPLDISNEIRKEVQESKRKFDLILVDGMHLMRSNQSPNGTFAGDDWRVMRAVSMQLLNLAQDETYKTRVVATSQIKSNIDPNKCGGFTFDDIGYSKGVAQDASIVAVLSKSDGAIRSVTPKTRILWAHMLKNRNGDDAGGVDVSQIKIDYASMNMYSGSTNFNYELSSLPLGAETKVT